MGNSDETKKTFSLSGKTGMWIGIGLLLGGVGLGAYALTKKNKSAKKQGKLAGCGKKKGKKSKKSGKRRKAIGF